MKRASLISIVFCITVASFLIFTTESFSKATVTKQKDGTINGLVFTFDPELKVTLPGLGEIVVAKVEIIAKGKEHIVITSKQYNYDAKFEGSSDDGKDFVLDGKLKPIKLISGSLSEHFTDPNFNPETDNVPPDVDLFFKSVLSTVDPVSKEVYIFSLDLKLKHGDVQFRK